MAIDAADPTRPVRQATRVAAAQAERAATRHAEAKAKAEAEAARIRERTAEARPPAHSIAFRHDAELNRVIVEVVDPATGAVVRSIPPEEIVHMFRAIRRVQGQLLDEEA
jgi:flagellar protein FlaG